MPSSRGGARVPPQQQRAVHPRSALPSPLPPRSQALPEALPGEIGRPPRRGRQKWTSAGGGDAQRRRQRPRSAAEPNTGPSSFGPATAAAAMIVRHPRDACRRDRPVSALSGTDTDRKRRRRHPAADGREHAWRRPVLVMAGPPSECDEARRPLLDTSPQPPRARPPPRASSRSGRRAANARTPTRAARRSREKAVTWRDAEEAIETIERELREEEEEAMREVEANERDRFEHREALLLEQQL